MVCFGAARVPSLRSSFWYRLGLADTDPDDVETVGISKSTMVLGVTAVVLHERDLLPGRERFEVLFASVGKKL